MSRELIVSVNGREKKIAIVENERVTEFYIERGEQNQGIVGNIYKGRVMRVLPGMQSAFVDIGLERDAFLYVTDFFDEEAEFERIVVDKSKKGDPEAATRAAAEHIELGRVQREQQVESTHERAEPLREVEFDLEDVPSLPVGSLLTEGLNEGGDFERVADDEDGSTVSRPSGRQLEEAHAEFVDEVPDASPRRLSFQRVSDDEEAAASAQ